MVAKKSKPIIGITSDFFPGDPEPPAKREPTYFLRARYTAAIEEMGGIPIILPIAQSSDGLHRQLDRIDGLMITGSGPDLDPGLYGEEKQYRYKVMSHQRARFELTMTRMAVDRNLPLLGVCGGMQVLNVAFGGTLIQDIQAQIQNAHRHQQKDSAAESSHEVRIHPGTRLFEIMKVPVIRVNSSHHQAVKIVGQGLVANAVAPDGIIEGLEQPQGRFAIGVQWHPEFLYQNDEKSRQLFEAFLNIAAQN